MNETAVELLLFGFLVLTAITIAGLRNLFAIALLSGVFSLLSAALFVSLDAVDVAFTEAAVGAGISTVLMLGALALTAQEEKRPARTTYLPLLLCAVTGAALLYGTADLPPFGSPLAPVHQHVGPDYIARAPVETGVPNLVTAILASYRGFDTLGETTVIFTAGIAVLFLLGGTRRKTGSGSGESEGGQHHLILRVIAKFLIPPIVLFALYVQWHGDYGPGGGFQAGVMFALAFILYGLIFGAEALMRIAPVALVRAAMGAGLLLYAGTGIVSFLLGGNYLDYSGFAHDPVHGQEWGILAVELGVGIAVATSMIAIFTAFAARPPAIKDEDW